MSQREFLERFYADLKRGADLENLWKDSAAEFGWVVKDRLRCQNSPGFDIRSFPLRFCQNTSALCTEFRYSLHRDIVHTVLQGKAVSLASGGPRPEKLPITPLELQIDIPMAKFQGRFDMLERGLDLTLAEFRKSLNETFVQLVTYLAEPFPQQQTPFWKSLEASRGETTMASSGVLLNLRDMADIPLSLRESLTGPLLTSRHVPEGTVFVLPQPEEFGDFTLHPESLPGFKVVATRREHKGGAILSYKISGGFSLVCWGEKPPVILLKTKHAKP